MSKIGILIIDDDEVSQSALRQVLDSDGWTVRVVGHIDNALAELSSGEWSLVIINISMTGLAGPVFSTLKELALAPGIEDGKARVRVLFILSEAAAQEAQPILERDRLPYVLKPFHFQDFLEKVSDLLMETTALTEPIRRVRHDTQAAERKRSAIRAGQEADTRRGRYGNEMFAKRSEYVMTEEEISEYEKTEQSQQELKKKNKRPGER